jgi:hypothetical protein
MTLEQRTLAGRDVHLVNVHEHETNLAVWIAFRKAPACWLAVSVEFDDTINRRGEEALI